VTRHLTTADLDDLADAYAAGKSFAQVAAEVGRNPDAVRLALRRHGVEARPPATERPETRSVVPDDVVRMHIEGGLSVQEIACHLGVSRGPIVRKIKELGATPRGRSESMTVRMSRATAEERSELAKAAHDAVRGKGLTPEHSHKIALGKEASGYGGPFSAGNEWLAERLSQRSVEHVREKAVGPYNLDFALTTSPVAVEVLGGNWHGVKPIHAQRTPYILNAGWHIVFVWNVKGCQIGSGALDYIVAFAEESRRNPSSRRQYRVIRGDGQLVSAGCADDEKFPLVPPSVRDLH